MHKGLLPAVAALIILALLAPGCKSPSPQAAAPASPVAASKGSAVRGASKGPVRTLSVALRLPRGWKQTYAPSRGGDAHDGCPSTQMSKVLGISFSSSHGCVIGSVQAGGAAEKAGLQVGDSISRCNGGAVDCPATLDPLLWTSQGDTAELVVVRTPVVSTAPQSKPAPSGPSPE